jgi:acyl-CoA hydrolase
MGIGSIPDAVLRRLTTKRHLGVHTEMFSDGLVELFEAGVTTNTRKVLHPGGASTHSSTTIPSSSSIRVTAPTMWPW